jgi:hypothetical protein
MSVLTEVDRGVRVVTVSGSLGRRVPDLVTMVMEQESRSVRKLVVVIESAVANEPGTINSVLHVRPMLAEHRVRCIWVLPPASHLEHQLKQMGVAGLFLLAHSREAAINSLL